MNKLRVLSVLVLVSVTLFVAGCGGGGASSVPVEKDVAGITRTLGDFMAAARAGDQTKLQSLMASSSEYYLMVKDFGADINDPNDNQSYEFYVSPDLISQPSANVAYVYASYRLHSGKTLWLYFIMAREAGRWIIEEMASKAPTAGGHVEPTHSSTEFVVASYRPINSSIKRIFSVEDNLGNASTTRVVSSYANEFTEGDITFYKIGELRVGPESPAYNGAGSLNGNLISGIAESVKRNLCSSRLGIRAATGDTTEGEAYFGFDSQKALWFKISDTASIQFNSGQPVKLLEPSHPFGSKRVVNYSFVADGSNYSVTVTIDIGFPIITGFETPLKTYDSVVPLTITEVDDASSEVGKWIEYYAPGVGEVGYDELDSNSTPTEKNRIMTRFNDDGSLNERNDPIITNTITSLGSYNPGDTITPMQVNVSGGKSPYQFRWYAAGGTPSSLYGVTLSSTGMLVGTASGSGAGETFSGKVEVVDKYGRSSNEAFTVTVAASGGGGIMVN